MIYNGHTVQGVDNAEALSVKHPAHILSSLDPVMLVFYVLVIVFCVYVLKMQKKDSVLKNAPEIFSRRSYFLLMLSGSMLVFIAFKIVSLFPEFASVTIYGVFALQGLFAWYLVTQDDLSFVQVINLERQREIESGARRPISVYLMYFFVVATTLVGGAILFGVVYFLIVKIPGSQLTWADIW